MEADVARLAECKELPAPPASEVWRASGRAVKRAWIVLLFCAGVAHADIPGAGDLRIPDRWFYEVYTGVSSSIASSIARQSQGQAALLASGGSTGASWVVGLGTTYWPCDYFGMGLDIELFDWSFPQPKNPELDFAGFAARVTPTARVAVPLRYLQPYVGIAPSFL